MAVASAQMLGGLHDEKPTDDEVRKVVSSVHSQLEDAAKQKYVSVEPISYRKQIVAGANYFIKVSNPQIKIITTAQDLHECTLWCMMFGIYLTGLFWLSFLPNFCNQAIVTAKDGTKSHIHMRVYKPFRGPLELSAVKTNQDKSKPLEYFQ